MNMQAVLSEINSWPMEDRVRLMEHLWDQLGDQGYEPLLTERVKEELDRRCDKLGRHPEATVPWEVVKARALQHLSK